MRIVIRMLLCTTLITIVSRSKEIKVLHNYATDALKMKQNLNTNKGYSRECFL